MIRLSIIALLFLQSGYLAFADVCLRPTLRNIVLSEAVMAQTSRDQLIARLDKMKNNLNSEDYDWVIAQFMLDRENVVIHPNRESEELIHIWDQRGKLYFNRLSPFNNYKKTLTELVLNSQNPVNLAYLKKLHVSLMKGGMLNGNVEGIATADIGVVRKSSEIGFVPTYRDLGLVKLGVNPLLRSTRAVLNGKRVSWVNYVDTATFIDPKLLEYIKTKDEALFHRMSSGLKSEDFPKALELLTQKLWISTKTRSLDLLETT